MVVGSIGEIGTHVYFRHLIGHSADLGVEGASIVNSGLATVGPELCEFTADSSSLPQPERRQFHWFNHT